jgi:phospholipid-transporting ATPase
VLAVFGRTASLFPLLFVLIVTAIKDGYEDWGRRRSDRKVNAARCSRREGGRWAACAWRELRVGDVVRLEADEVVPCDLVLLATSAATGTAYTETMNLDGETNLKSRQARLETQRGGGVEVRGRVVCEPPNRNIYEFTAYLDLGEGPISLSAATMLLRGCVLRNTEWAVGVVAYAGPDTKAMLNNSGAQSKRSKLEKAMNRETLFLALILGVLCGIGAIGMGVWLNEHDIARLPYFGAGGEYHGKAGEALLNFFSLIILLQILVPISLYISMELVRLFQALLMQQDLQLYHEPTDARLKCRALNINEDLGQIRYVFSDKTGTLTQNRMVFHAASVAGVDYSHATAVEAAPLVPAAAAQNAELAPQVKEGEPEHRPLLTDVIASHSLPGSEEDWQRKVCGAWSKELTCCAHALPFRSDFGGRSLPTSFLHSRTGYQPYAD